MNDDRTDLETLLTLDELAARLRVSRRWLYEELAKGTIPHHRIGRRRHLVRFRASEVERWIGEPPVDPTYERKPADSR